MEYTYTYDVNGNMTVGHDFTDINNIATRAVTYNADNLPTHIEHTNGGSTVITDILYDGDSQKAKNAIQGGSTTYHINKHGNNGVRSRILNVFQYLSKFKT